MVLVDRDMVFLHLQLNIISNFDLNSLESSIILSQLGHFPGTSLIGTN
jgi:hypothetical protein